MHSIPNAILWVLNKKNVYKSESILQNPILYQHYVPSWEWGSSWEKPHPFAHSSRKCNTWEQNDHIFESIMILFEPQFIEKP